MEGADVAAEVARALVKQACERIDRLRKVLLLYFPNAWRWRQDTLWLETHTRHRTQG